MFVGTHNCGVVALCNKVFVLVLSGPGTAGTDIHKHSSTVHLTAQRRRVSERHAPNLPTTTVSSAQLSSAPAPHAWSRAEGGAGLLQGSGPEGSCLEFLREIAGLSVLQRLQLVQLATPCTNIEDLKP